MKIGLLSDTHGFFDKKIYNYFKDVDEIWHAGDIGNIKVLDDLIGFKKTRVVYGNIDDYKIRNCCEKELIFSINNHNIYITHIGGRPPNYNKEVINKLKKIRPTIFICGHSHILNISKDKNFNLLYINPGAAGKVGFQKDRTLVRFQITSKNVTSMEVIKL
tara:strand:+ start:2890 stop:3372 length:483 start_codon:yes stop_codon:yes gene_type:complete